MTEADCLELVVAVAQYFYYGGKDGGGLPIMSDATYDNLEKRLAKEKPDSFLLTTTRSEYNIIKLMEQFK